MNRIKEELRKAFHTGRNVIIRYGVPPGHKDITGNEYAGSVARKAVDSKSVTQMFISKKDVNIIIREKEAAVRENI